METFISFEIEVLADKLEAFKQEFSKDINKSGKSYISDIRLAVNPYGSERNNDLLFKRLRANVYIDDYIDWNRNNLKNLESERGK